MSLPTPQRVSISAETLPTPPTPTMMMVSSRIRCKAAHATRRVCLACGWGVRLGVQQASWLEPLEPGRPTGLVVVDDAHALERHQTAVGVVIHDLCAHLRDLLPVGSPAEAHTDHTRRSTSYTRRQDADWAPSGQLHRPRALVLQLPLQHRILRLQGRDTLLESTSSRRLWRRGHVASSQCQGFQWEGPANFGSCRPRKCSRTN